MCRLVTFFILFFAVQNICAQTRIQGYLIDTLTNNYLRSGSIAVYQDGQKTVTKIGLTDRFGKFAIDLPENKSYRAEFSYQGYQKLSKNFTLTKGQTFDFGKIHLIQQSYEIDEVTILPPVRMNGDTIEFNADAFQLDTNAVIEDLIHQLPGMIVWGDGKITYNGKEVPTVLINGKEFFGSDKSIALQNIAKDAIQKVQLYDTRDLQSKQSNPIDPNYEMNVVLKEGKERMLFGNITLGVGTEKRNESFANFNYANKKSQSSIAYTKNNTNKKLNNLDQLLKNTTYKGVGIHANYQSDFRRPGFNNQNAVAARYQHDFLQTKETNKKHLLTGNVFSNWDIDNVQNNSITTILNNTEDSNTRSNTNSTTSNNRNTRANVDYNYQNEWKGRSASIRLLASMSDEAQNEKKKSETIYDYTNNQSNHQRQEQRETSGDNASINLSMSLGQKQYSVKKLNLFEKLNYSLNWQSNLNKDHSLNNSSTHIENYLDANKDQDIIRIYKGDNTSNTNNFSFIVSNRDFTLTNTLNLNKRITDNRVENLDDDVIELNNSLTHQSDYNQLTYTPNLLYTYRFIERNYTGRFSTSLSLQPQLAVRMLNRKNVSTLDYRNIQQDFISYLPAVNLKYDYSKYGAYLITANLDYQHYENIPSLDQLRPIYDNNNPSYRYFGNPNLSLSQTETFKTRFRYQEHKVQSLMLNLTSSYDIRRNVVRDSTIFAPNQQQVYAVNMEKSLYNFSIKTDVSKPFKISNTQTLSFELTASTIWSSDVQYTNAILQELNPSEQNVSFQTYFTHLDKYQIAWKANFNRYNNNNITTPTNNFVSKEYGTGISTSYRITKKLNLSSNVDSRFIISDRHKENLVIWNAYAAYRLAKGNNFEAKLAVFDILDKNKGIYINNSVSEFTQGYRNNLNQFFLLSLSYFPRKFGL